MCLSVCGDVVYGSGWFILSTVGPVISWGWASLSPRPAQPSPAPGPGWAREYWWNAGPDWRPAQAPHTFLSEPITPNTSLRFVWEWVVGNVAIIHSLYFILIFYDGGWMHRKERQAFTGACWKFMTVLATKQILAVVLCSTRRKVDLRLYFSCGLCGEYVT